MPLNSFGISHVGTRRKRNEDYYILNESLGLFLVADGMGGHAGGEYASKIASLLVEEHVMSQSRLDPQTSELKQPFTESLVHALQFASERVYAKASDESELHGMGTTLTALKIDADTLTIAHVGDSRAYLYRKNELKVLTRDHSLVYEKLEAGELTEVEAKTFPYKNVLTRSVGVFPVVDVDTVTLQLLPKDRLMICSDGVYNVLSNPEIGGYLKTPSLDTAGETLIQSCLDRQCDDNITIVLVEIL